VPLRGPSEDKIGHFEVDSEEISEDCSPDLSDEIIRENDNNIAQSAENNISINKRNKRVRFAENITVHQEVSSDKDPVYHNTKSVSNNLFNNINLTNSSSSSSSSTFQIPKRMRITVPINDRLQKVKYINTEKVLQRAGVTHDEAVAMLEVQAAAVEAGLPPTMFTTSSDPTPNVPPPRWARRKLLMAVRKATKSRTDNPTIKTALQSPDWREWIAAFDTEFSTLEEGQQWEVVLRVPPGCQILPSNLVLVQKRVSTGAQTKKKGRLVAGGNYRDSTLLEAISSPTCRSASVKLLFSIAAKQGLKLEWLMLKQLILRHYYPKRMKYICDFHLVREKSMENLYSMIHLLMLN
jgi:hypothetical protein